MTIGTWVWVQVNKHSLITYSFNILLFSTYWWSVCFVLGTQISVTRGPHPHHSICELGVGVRKETLRPSDHRYLNVRTFVGHTNRMVTQTRWSLVLAHSPFLCQWHHLSQRGGWRPSSSFRTDLKSKPEKPGRLQCLLFLTWVFPRKQSWSCKRNARFQC